MDLGTGHGDERYGGQEPLLRDVVRIPRMPEGADGAIVDSPSAEEVVGQGMRFYIASKRAVDGLTTTAALDNGTQGIPVNARRLP